MQVNRFKSVSVLCGFALIVGCSTTGHRTPSSIRPQLESDTAVSSDAPTPLVDKNSPVDWWFVFKFNSKVFPGCGGDAAPSCLTGGDVQKYDNAGQQFAYATSEDSTLTQGGGCAGDTTTDPVGATFNQIYKGAYYYVIWNDQFYDDPKIDGCTKECGSPWGHSKGVVAWNEAGEGLVMQVSTPSWPASGSSKFPRKTDGNTLGCVKDDDVEVSQHFFALKLNKDDLIKVLTALSNSSVVTNPQDRQIVNNGGPEDVKKLVAGLGVKSDSANYSISELSTGVRLISKPSNLNVPPWQMVSAILGGVSLRTATWWAVPKINSTTASTEIACWDKSLHEPGAVEIATTGHWDDKEFGLTGGLGPDFNHAKLGVSTSDTGDDHYAIFGDMNQQGALSGNCRSSQNGRGGLFYVVNDEDLSSSVSDLIAGDSASDQSSEKDAKPDAPDTIKGGNKLKTMAKVPVHK